MFMLFLATVGTVFLCPFKNTFGRLMGVALNLHTIVRKFINFSYCTFPVAVVIKKKKTKKNLPAMQETQCRLVRSLGREDPLEEGMAAHSGILAWWIPWTEEPGGLQSTGSQRVGQNWSDWTHEHSELSNTWYSCQFIYFPKKCLPLKFLFSL